MSTPQRLLAIDIGLKTGFAVYDANGLVSYRATRFPSPAAIKRAAWGLLREIDGLTHVFAEGDRRLSGYWQKAAEKQGLAFRNVRPETWRQVVLLPREQRDGATAKKAAFDRALELIEASTAAAPKHDLTSDVAEAVLIGHWAWLELDWQSPPQG